LADDGVAFRYVIPRSTPLGDIPIDDEVTEFDVAGASTGSKALPFVVEQPGVGWVAITEVRVAQYPRVRLVRAEGTILVRRLATAFEGATPLTCPWRVALVGRDRERLLQSEFLRGLGR